MDHDHNFRPTQSGVRLDTVRPNVVERADRPGFTDAYEFLRAVYNASELPLHVRMEAARVAIKYEKPALATAEKTSSMDNLAGLVEAARKRALERNVKAE